MGLASRTSEKYQGLVIFASCPDDEISISEAKKFITDNNYTNEQVRLYKSEGVVCVAIK
jgi:endo-beta-N-acetylglucosaminidase D